MYERLLKVCLIGVFEWGQYSRVSSSRLQSHGMSALPACPTPTCLPGLPVSCLFIDSITFNC
jgi:hypothetical protein